MIDEEATQSYNKARVNRVLASQQGWQAPGKSAASLSLFWSGVGSEITKRQQETQQKELGPETATYNKEEKQLIDTELVETTAEIPMWGGLFGLSLPLVSCKNHKTLLSRIVSFVTLWRLLSRGTVPFCH